jgi:hypothetical protein
MHYNVPGAVAVFALRSGPDSLSGVCYSEGSKKCVCVYRRRAAANKKSARAAGPHAATAQNKNGRE